MLIVMSNNNRLKSKHIFDFYTICLPFSANTDENYE